MRNLYSLFIFIAIVSCGNKQTLKVSEIHSFPKEEHISITSMNIGNQLPSSGRIFHFKDFLALRTADYDGGLITIVPLNNKDSIVKRIVQKGRGPNELLNVWYLTSEDSKNNFWAFDLIASEVMKLNSKNVYDTIALQPTKISLKDDATHGTLAIDLLNDAEFICTGRYNGFRVAKIDTAGNVIKKIGLNPEITEKTEFNQYLNEAYQGAIKRKPDGTKFIIACRFSDQIEIFDSNKADQELVIKGPLFTEPTFKVTSAGNGESMILDSKETSKCYNDVTVTNEYIIGLFSGEKLEEEGTNNKSAIHIFDWNGNAVAKLFINQECASLTIDTTNNRVYLFGGGMIPEIYYFDLNI